VERIAPIYAVAIAVVAGDALGNFHLAISLPFAVALAALALSAFLFARPVLGATIAYLAIACAATAAVANLLAPPRVAHSVATMVEGSRVTIEGRVYRETEHEGYGDRIYVAVE